MTLRELRSRDYGTRSIPRRALAPGAVDVDILDVTLRPGGSAFAAGVVGAVRSSLPAGGLPRGVVQAPNIDVEAVTTPHLRDRSVQRPKIDVDAVGSDELAAIAVAVDKWIRSSNYDPSVPDDERVGWAVDGDGFFELAGGVIRGNTSIGGVVTSQIVSPDFDPDADIEDRTGFALGQDGAAEFHSVVVRGGVMVGTDLFSANYDPSVPIEEREGYAFAADGTFELGGGYFRGEIEAEGGTISGVLSVTGGISTTQVLGYTAGLWGAGGEGKTYPSISFQDASTGITAFMGPYGQTGAPAFGVGTSPGNPAVAIAVEGSRLTTLDVAEVDADELTATDLDVTGSILVPTSRLIVTPTSSLIGYPSGMSVTWGSRLSGSWPTSNGVLVTHHFGAVSETFQEYTGGGTQAAGPNRWIRRWNPDQSGWTGWRQLS